MSNALRRIFNGVVLGGLMLLAQRQAVAQAPVRDFSPAEKDSINKELVMEAQRQFGRIAVVGENPFSRGLQDLEQRLSRHLENENESVQDRVVVVQPQQLDVGIALGMKPAQVVDSLMRMRNAGLEHDSLQLDLMGFFANRTYESRYGTEVGNQLPHAFASRDGNQPSVMFPVSNFTLDEYVIKGMSFDEVRDFINRHEGWHCVDTRTILKFDNFTPVRVGFMDLDKMPSDTVSLEFACTVNCQEMLADIGAVGDMVRAGAGVNVIQAVKNWRMANYRDYLHQSEDGLTALQAEIKNMGLSKFRKLDQDSAHALYARIMEEQSLNPGVLRAMIEYKTASGPKKTSLRIKSKKDPVLKMGIAKWEQIRKREVLSKKVLSNAWNRIREPRSLKDWDPMAVMIESAMAESGEITPVSMVHAYNGLYTSLQNEMGDKHDPVIAEKLLRLKQSFVGSVTEMDYVTLNADRGIDITNRKQMLASSENAGQNPRTDSGGKTIHIMGFGNTRNR